MPKYYEDKEEDNRACAGVREDLKTCLLEHECVVKVSSFYSDIIMLYID